MPLENFTYGNTFFDIEHLVHAGIYIFYIKSRLSFKIFFPFYVLVLNGTQFIFISVAGKVLWGFLDFC